MNSIPCDIVLLPEDALAQKAITASQILSRHDSFFTLENGKYYPHMSLYMFQLNENDISKVEEVLAKIASELKTIRVKATRYYLGEGFGVGYIDPEYEVTDELKTIQSKVIEAVNPIRAGMRESDIAKMQDSKGLKLKNLEKYGYPAAGDLFRPHITLTRLREHKPEIVELLPNVGTFNGSFSKIGLFEMGDNGTCIKEIISYSLAKTLNKI